MHCELSNWVCLVRLFINIEFKLLLNYSTLYCAKTNYEFGLSRIAHALEGGSGASLCADTWLHVKRCVLGLLSALAKQCIVFPSAAIQEILNFLHSCEGAFFLRTTNWKLLYFCFSFWHCYSICTYFTN